MIDEADRGGDGEVNEKEFLRIMKKTISPEALEHILSGVRISSEVLSWVNTLAKLEHYLSMLVLPISEVACPRQVGALHLQVGLTQLRVGRCPRQVGKYISNILGLPISELAVALAKLEHYISNNWCCPSQSWPCTRQVGTLHLQ